MILQISGAFLLALGLFAGSVLVLVPLGMVPWTADVVLWLLFPVFSVLGFVLLATAARAGSVRSVLHVASGLLLLLAAASALALVLRAASIASGAGASSPLWFVLGVAGLLGIVGAATHAKATSAD
jgi:hypothetical protein